MKTKHCFHLGGCLGKTLLYTEKMFYHSNYLKFYFFSFFKFKFFFHPNCRRCSKALLLHYAEYLLLNKRLVHLMLKHIYVTYAFFNSFCNWRRFLLYVCVCVCVCFYCIFDALQTTPLSETP